MINKVILVGNVGQDPEVRSTNSGRKWARFPLATNETYTADGEKKTQTTWHNIVVWGRSAEIAEQYIRKGRQLYIEGRLQNNEWTDKEGIKRYGVQVQANRFQLLGGRRDEDGTGTSFARTAEPKPADGYELVDDFNFDYNN